MTSSRQPSVNATILTIATRLNIGGPSTQILAIIDKIDGDFQMRLASGAAPAHEGEMAHDSIAVRTLPLVRPIRPSMDAKAAVAIRRLLHELQPQVLHTHMAKAGAIGRLAALSGRARPKLVHTYHGHVLSGYFKRPQQQAFVRLERLLARSTDVLVAVSPEIRDELLALGIGKASQYRVISIGVDLDRYDHRAPAEPPLRETLHVESGAPLVGIVGRLTAIKDHTTLLHALSQLPDVHLAVIGDGELRGELEELSRNLGMARRVHFLGWSSDIPSLLCELDLVVQSSRNEGTPVALIEALAARRPVVATDVGGVRHVIEDHETGWLCPPADASALADVLSYALAHPEEGERMAAAGRKHVEARFALAEMVQQHRLLYEELISGSR